MAKNFHYFSKDECPADDVISKIGIRGVRAKELAQLKMPILPGLIIDSDIASKLADKNLSDVLHKFCEKAEKEIGKKFADFDNPSILKIVISPSMEIVTYPSIHTIGLTDNTIKGFEKMVGEHFAYHEYARFLIRGAIDLLIKIESKKSDSKNSNLDKMISLLEKIDIPVKIDEDSFEKNVIAKISLTEEKFVIQSIYIKDAKTKSYLLDFKAGLKSKKKMLDTLSYLEHREIGEDEYDKFIRKHTNRILNSINFQPTNVEDYKQIINEARDFLPKEFFTDAYFQLEFLIKKVSEFLQLEEMDDDDTAIIIQPMVYGNYGKDSYSGKFYTRNIVTGEKTLQGSFYQDKFDDTSGTDAIDINKIDPKFKKELERIADELECYFKEIRQIKFTIEKGKLWIIEQTQVMSKSTQASLKSLLYLLSKKIVNEEYVVKHINPSEMSDILHPVINPESVKKMKSIDGGINGAPGAARGRVYFSTEALLEAYRKAIAEEKDKSVILVLPATYAEDVKAIEVSKGVLSCEGGYSAHASVVARQYGKVSLVNPELKIDVKKKQFSIGDIIVKEGEYITLDVPYYGRPRIILGKAELIEPDPKDSGLLDFIEITNKFLKNFRVYGNADTPKDAALVKKFGGEGIGLCRTEHMFFQPERINVFREMIMASNKEERVKSLKKLQKMQTEDFYGIFKNMAPYPVTIRLLDAPLHEFLPHTKEEMEDFIEYMGKVNPELTRADIEYKCEAIEEVNPMLGHRGCRIAISYPEIYEMQLISIFEAAYQLQEEGIDVEPEIMIPIVMNIQEMKAIKNGKKIEGGFIKGIIQVEQEVRDRLKAKKPLEYKVGTMIELPAAVLSSGELAQYAEFFSFGTNDLTQTTHGLSRDDFNTFLPDYSKYDIIEANPFQILSEPVKEMILISTQRGRLTRPDLKVGLCGEQGADPRNLEFLRKAGLNYVSCSSYSIPIAKLAIAQMEIENK
ncbi:MAG TPA: PEP-utilizing enzyme [Spirochaetota bacterium]|nr:PEP-utilizing enzyme [Spirochaetota bacterium]HOL57065.1 PEP-utilizing enzyme [Spirochaetota bacterium]HPP04587.1 PEP-utilizing enzyme [Spirochaetota bacterium]